MAATLTPRLGALASNRERQSFVGRNAEIAALDRILDPGGPLIAFVYGLAGMGKSTLLMAFALRARERGASVIQIDGGLVEPTRRGILAAINDGLGGEPDADPIARLAAIGTTVVIAIDSYEALRMSDAWLRQELIGGLPANVRIVLAGREPPALPWFGAAGWPGSLATIEVGPLDPVAALELLRSAGVRDDAAHRVARIAHGHPLALRVAAATVGGADPSIEETAAQQVLEALAQRYLEKLDPLLRRALDAASVVRRTTPSLVAAMLPDTVAQDVYERLRELPFVRQGADGLVLHDAMQQAIATRLRVEDATRARTYRQAAWRQLRDELRGAGPADLWRCTAGMLYLIEHPLLRDAIFPVGGQVHSVEPSQAADGAAVLEMVSRHDGPQGAGLLQQWWARAPESFRMVRDRNGEISGLGIVYESNTVEPKRRPVDPVDVVWRDHLRRSPVPAGQVVLFDRRALDRTLGEGWGSAQAALFLDVKRHYMELRPRLRRLYFASYTALESLPVLMPLGFVRVPEADVELDGRRFHTVMLDFGPGSVDGWLARIAASELGIPQDELLDLDAHELVLDGRRVALTKLEYQLMHYLMQHEGKAVTRAELLADVWGYGYEGDANVVEVAVSALRRKLGGEASMVSTVRGVGYRYRHD
jgi:hypothetical protein